MAKAVEVSVTSWRKNLVKAGAERGRVLLMPGTGYTCDRPLLYWSGQALAQDGWRIDRMNVRNASDDLSAVLPVLCDAVDRWVGEVRGEAAAAGRPAPRLLLIGKSLTTMTYPHVACAFGLPFVLLTPVLHHADFDPSRRVIPVPAMADGALRAEDDPALAAARVAAGLGAAARPAAGGAVGAGEGVGIAGAGGADARAAAYPGPAPLVCAGTADPFYDRARANALTPHVHEYPDANHSIEVPGHWRRSLDFLKEVTASVSQYAATI
ncbi:hypothetical protein H7U32_06825 [Bifidobacterium pullorum subsp. saeculare]|uniref:Alpha/beta hydrolase n=1 Tax=Bifidobacterium pullorum subsp. saeculare TaxID=78257 RepID=A0A938WYP2_9BIFI|nr:hypothetical protein [Bifidobacterium pullorum]MBM6700020.1 hypothetical protein [Bifidobacterium pullorum subsp. saeculare]